MLFLLRYNYYFKIYFTFFFASACPFSAFALYSKGLSKDFCYKTDGEQ